MNGYIREQALVNVASLRKKIPDLCHQVAKQLLENLESKRRLTFDILVATVTIRFQYAFCCLPGVRRNWRH